MSQWTCGKAEFKSSVTLLQRSTTYWAVLSRAKKEINMLEQVQDNQGAETQHKQMLRKLAFIREQPDLTRPALSMSRATA